MADLFDDPLASDLSFALKAETDGDSGLSQLLFDKLRKSIEGLIELGFGTGTEGTATSISETVLTDTGLSLDADAEIGRTLFIISGDAAGNIYTIDDNSTTTITCTGDTMSTDGVEVGDDYLILYDIKKSRSEGGHVHDGEDSALVENTLGRTLVAQYAGETLSSTSQTYAEQLKFNVYIPANSSTLLFRCEIQATSGYTAYVKVEITDSDSTSDDDEQTTTATSMTAKNGTIDASGLAEGWGTITVYLRTSTVTNAAYTENFTMYWNN